MPKHKDKSFELMASIGEAKQPKEPDAIPVSKVKATQDREATEKKLKVKKVSNIPYLPPSMAMKKQLKRLALEEDTSMTALISEGLNLIFKSRGLKTIEQLTGDT